MNKFFLLLAFATNTLFSQEVCKSPEASIDDLNSITKCLIQDVKKNNQKNTRHISVKISAPKKRYLKKRIVQKKEIASTLNNLSTSGISESNHATEISNSLEFKKENNAINNILSLTNRLSKEEIKKAVKFDETSNIPLFKNCKDISNTNQLGCFNKEMVKHIEKHFNYPNEAVIKKIEGNVWIRFIIGKDGNVTNIKNFRS